MRNAYVSVRTRFLAVLMLVGLAPAALAAPANVYDKYRSVSYSNKGLLSESDEVRVGAQVHQEQVLQKFRLVEDPSVVEYVEQLGRRVAERSARPDLDYHFFVVDDPSVNAFSIPGGFIYVHTGLLRIVETEDELAAVLAHEIAHVVARHGLRNLKSAQKAKIGILGAVIAGTILGGGTGARAAGGVAQIAAAGTLTKHSRDFEREADFLGLYNTVEAGYDPSAMIGIFEKLGRSGSKSSMGGIFASHPDSRERVRNTQTEISQRLGTQARRSRRPRAGWRDDDAFAEMKQALSRPGYDRYGRYGRQDRDGRYGDDRYSDPRDDRRRTDRYDPGPYNPPPMRRRTSTP